VKADVDSTEPGDAGGGFAGPWLIPDQDYLGFIERLFASAERRCLASLFVVGAAPWRDRQALAEGLLRELAEARWRGVDARLLVGGSPDNTMGAELAREAERRANVLRVPCRWLTRTPQLANHARVVVADDHVLVGTHGWLERAAAEQAKDSVCVTSTSLARQLTDRFNNQWRTAVGGSA
jgi:phosphatidylserine/phosphatidylglycerophosphate/cardiolipin synthase-like enzyme